jgi:hypothetical protein
MIGMFELVKTRSLKICENLILVVEDVFEIAKERTRSVCEGCYSMVCDASILIVAEIAFFSSTRESVCDTLQVDERIGWKTMAISIQMQISSNSIKG